MPINRAKGERTLPPKTPRGRSELSFRSDLHAGLFNRSPSSSDLTTAYNLSSCRCRRAICPRIFSRRVKARFSWTYQRSKSARHLSSRSSRAIRIGSRVLRGKGLSPWGDGRE